MNLLQKYNNGNYTVSIFDDGTKEREFEETPNPIWPESMDVKVTDYCDAGCKFCFLPDSQILTISGNKPIESIKIGDSVYSTEEDSKKLEVSVVEGVLFKFVDENVIVVELENGKFIRCTSDHEIFTTNRGYVKAAELSVNDDIRHIF